MDPRSVDADPVFYRDPGRPGTGGTSTTGFFAGRPSGALVMTVAVRFEDAQGEFYVAALFIRLNSFAKIIETVGGAGLGTAILVGADGTQLLPPVLPDAEAGILDDETIRRVIEGGEGTVRLFLPDGSEGPGAFVWLPALNAGLIVRLDETELLVMTPVFGTRCCGSDWRR